MMISDILILGENRKVSRELSAKLQSPGCNIEVLMAAGGNIETTVSKVAEALNGRQLILVFRNEELKNVSGLLFAKGVEQLFVCPWDTHCFENEDNVFNRCVIPVDNRKPRLDYLEIEVAEGCNLNCKGCNEFSNLVDAKRFSDLETVKQDLLRLKELFWGIGKIRLMGGEPLINPDYVNFVRTAREIFPDSDIRLLSNGLLIPKLKKTDLEKLKNLNCSFDISNYPPTGKLIDEIERTLNEAGISFSLSLPNKFFFRSLMREPNDSPNEAFGNCLFTHCHAVSGGYLSSCSNQMYAYRLNDAFGLSFPTDDKIDIHNTHLNGWEINDIFGKPHEFCRYCAKGMVPYRWKPSPPGKAKEGDWLIDPTFINIKVAPFVQRVVKTPAKKLRDLVRKPKPNRQ